MKLVLAALSASVAYGWISPTAIRRQSTMLQGSIAPKGEEEEKEKSPTIVNFKAIIGLLLRLLCILVDFRLITTTL